MAEEKALTKQEQAATSELVVPQNKISVDKRGMEGANFDQSDFIIPRAKIVQALSKEATEGDVKPGSVVNTATGEILASPGEEFRVQVIIVSVGQLYMVQGEGRKCFSIDGVHGIGEPGGNCLVCPLAKWGANNEPPLCAKNYNYLSRFLDIEDPDVPVNLAISKSSAKTAKKINTRFRFMKGDIWELALRLKTAKTQNEKGTFYVWEFLGASKFGKDEQDQVEMGEAMYEFLSSTNYTLQPDEEVADDETDDTGERPEF